jgi:hypothetical protein
MNPTFFATPSAFRSWLEEHHDTTQEIWVGFYKTSSGKPSITWPEAVDQAPCYPPLLATREKGKRGCPAKCSDDDRQAELAEIGEALTVITTYNAPLIGPQLELVATGFWERGAYV